MCVSLCVSSDSHSPVSARMNSDKYNNEDYCWYVVRTRPRQERKLADLLEQHKAVSKNILEVYVPTHTTVNVCCGGKEKPAPLFAGIIFVLATQKALMDFISGHPADGDIQYERKTDTGEKARMRVIPEEQMRAFRDYNENYADRVIVLERPFADYAFNAKTHESNEIVRVIDGPLAGCKGYICRFRKEKRLVFRVQGMAPGSSLTVSYPNVWDLHAVRLHNTECDRLSVATQKERAADILIGILQSCGYGRATLPMLYRIIDSLAAKPSLNLLCKELAGSDDTALCTRLLQMSGEEAELVLNLARYEHDNPGYVRSVWSRLVLRPFLTPTSGTEMEKDRKEAELQHADFTETIRKVDITEDVYYPSRAEEGTVTTTYYAHVGIRKDEVGYTLFANWDKFLAEYFLTAGKAHKKLVSGTTQTVSRNGEDVEKLIGSFRNYAPTLHKTLTDGYSGVKAVQDFHVENETLNVFAVSVAEDELEQAKDHLIKVCTDICKEINTTTHLAVWRRYLRSVWLHV